MPAPSVVMLDDPDRVVEVLSPMRRRILTELRRPDSASGLARRLGSSRQKINYHLRALEDAGLVEVDELRARRGLTERIMRRTSDVVLVDPAAFDTAGLSLTDAAGVAGVVASAIDTIRRAARATSRASAKGERVAAASVEGDIRVASPAQLQALLEEMARLIARYDSAEEGLRVRVATTVLPETGP